MSYNPFTLINKTIFVTGASSGIGRVIAIECAKMGANIIVSGRNEARLQETFDLLEGDGHDKIVADFSNSEEIKSLSKKVTEIDGLVHCAGVSKTLPFPFVTQEYISSIMQVNFMAPTLLSQSLVKNKKLKKGSSIVFISSIDGPVTAHIGNSMYAASKGAITAMARNMAVDLASKNIRVNSVLPGIIDTPIIHGGEITTEQFDQVIKLYPLKRFGEPTEIAHAVIYFLSDASRWTTGANLVVDGGFTLL
jgi:NAD(P)-dependent dehydrogenase (short-subunit alcohol dehydrogenase family)